MDSELSHYVAGVLLIGAALANLSRVTGRSWLDNATLLFLSAIVLTASGDVVAEGMRGTLVYGHEERTVRLCGDGRIFWVTATADVRSRIVAAVERVTSRPYEPVMMDFDGAIVDRPLPGLAGDVAGIIEVPAICSISRDGVDACHKAASKIRFDLERLDVNGLQGPPDGLRALHYEYCVPDRSDAIAMVRELDPTLQIQRGARGRAGCDETEVLCLGNTHQPGYRAVLARLSRLCFVREIRQAFFE